MERLKRLPTTVRSLKFRRDRGRPLVILYLQKLTVSKKGRSVSRILPAVEILSSLLPRNIFARKNVQKTTKLNYWQSNTRQIGLIDAIWRKTTASLLSRLSRSSNSILSPIAEKLSVVVRRPRTKLLLA